MKQSTKEILWLAGGTVVLLAIVWLLPEVILKILITVFLVVFVWLMWKMDK